MSTLKRSPGPAARGAFRTGMVLAATAGLGGIGALYWWDVIGLLSVGVWLVVLFPVYLVVSASVLSVWLGYDKGPADLRPVHREQDTE